VLQGLIYYIYDFFGNAHFRFNILLFLVLQISNHRCEDSQVLR
jgi:hypothetical protein